MHQLKIPRIPLSSISFLLLYYQCQYIAYTIIWRYINSIIHGTNEISMAGNKTKLHGKLRRRFKIKFENLSNTNEIKLNSYIKIDIFNLKIIIFKKKKWNMENSSITLDSISYTFCSIFVSCHFTPKILSLSIIV